jgi:UDP-N-acetylglucosamine 2-epimerase (non-hydrolysing)
MKKLLFAVGTRPEAIKTIPVYLESINRKKFESKLLITGQHKELIDDVLDSFNIVPDFRLSDNSDIEGLIGTMRRLLKEIQDLITDYKPDLIFVHGDTLTAYVTSIVAFFSGVKLAHIESGLRTFDVKSPFPEEFFRVSIDKISDYHFCPTEMNLKNLMNEVKPKNYLITGNTGIDALRLMKDMNQSTSSKNRDYVLVTAHRRESFGEPLKNVFMTVNQLASDNTDIDFILPIHPNPMVILASRELNHNASNIIITKPHNYKDFTKLLMGARLIMTDSGGIQEEASYLGIPILILRDKTERQELLESSQAVLVGTNPSKIISGFVKLINLEYTMPNEAKGSNIFGDGYASKRIIDFFEDN